ncbi:putative molybdopterin binding domain protein, partial [Vibrio harveyi]
TLKPIL